MPRIAAKARRSGRSVALSPVSHPFPRTYEHEVYLDLFPRVACALFFSLGRRRSFGPSFRETLRVRKGRKKGAGRAQNIEATGLIYDGRTNRSIPIESLKLVLSPFKKGQPPHKFFQ